VPIAIIPLPPPSKITNFTNPPRPRITQDLPLLLPHHQGPAREHVLTRRLPPAARAAAGLRVHHRDGRAGGPTVSEFAVCGWRMDRGWLGGGCICVGSIHHHPNTQPPSHLHHTQHKHNNTHAHTTQAGLLRSLRGDGRHDRRPPGPRAKFAGTRLWDSLPAQPRCLHVRGVRCRCG
jgi:hypothetical protein